MICKIIDLRPKCDEFLECINFFNKNAPTLTNRGECMDCVVDKHNSDYRGSGLTGGTPPRSTPPPSPLAIMSPHMRWQSGDNEIIVVRGVEYALLMLFII